MLKIIKKLIETYSCSGATQCGFSTTLPTGVRLFFV